MKIPMRRAMEKIQEKQKDDGDGASLPVRKGSRGTARFTACVCLCALTAAAVLMTGCGDSSSEDSTKPVIMQNDDNVIISMSWWGNDQRHIYTLAGLQLFHDKHPDISVTPTYSVWDGYEIRNQIGMESHESADVMQINFDWLDTYSPDGTGYFDLNQLSDEIDLSGYSDSDLAFGTVDGRLNAIPIAYNSTAFFYNKTIYDRYGLEIPQTWDDLTAAAEVMSKDGVYPLGLTKKQMILSLAAWFEQKYGTPLMSGDCSLTDNKEGLKAAIAFYKSLIDTKVIPPIDDFDATRFTSGKTAGAGCWNSDASRYCDPLAEEGDEVVLGKTPGIDGPSTTGWHIKPATLYAISAYTDHPKEAGELLDFLINDSDMVKLQGTEKGVPINRTALQTLKDNNMLDDFEALAGEQMDRNKSQLSVMVPALENSDVISIFKSETDKYIYDNEDLDTCVSTIMEKIGALKKDS